MVILDVSDTGRPKMIGRLGFHGFANWLGCHSAVPIPGTQLVVANSEAIDESGLEPLDYPLTQSGSGNRFLDVL